MWIVKLLASMILIVAVLLFGLQNSGNRVDVKLGTADFYEVPLIYVVFFSILIGMILMFILVIGKNISNKVEVYKLKREISGLNKELANVRNLGLEEEIDSIDEPDDESEKIEKEQL